MGGITGRGVTGGDGAPSNEDYVTYSDETANLPNSRQLIAGDNITLDTTTPGELTIDAAGGAPGGADTEIQYNDAGAFAGSSKFRWNDTDRILTLTNDSIQDQQTIATGQTERLRVQAGTIDDLTFGRIDLDGGDGLTGDGGDVGIRAGDAVDTGDGGSVAIVAGANAVGGSGGFVTIQSQSASIDFRTGGSTTRLSISSTGEFLLGGDPGTAGQVITSNGASSSPTWESASVAETSGTFTATFTSGFTTQPTQDVSWTKIGSLVVLRFTTSVSATSNAVTFTTSAGDLPVNLRPPASICLGGTCGGTNNGAATEAFLLLTTSGSIAWQINTNGVATNWTNSGTKGISVGSTRLSTLVYSTTA